MKNYDLNKKVDYHNFFSSYKKWIIKLFMIKTKKKILNWAKEYYENNKERNCENKHEINMENYLTKKKVKKREHGRNRYQNISGED